MSNWLGGIVMKKIIHFSRDINVQAQFSVNQSRPEEITMREDLGSITLMGDDGFGKFSPMLDIFSHILFIWDLSQVNDREFYNTKNG